MASYVHAGRSNVIANTYTKVQVMQPALCPVRLYVSRVITERTVGVCQTAVIATDEDQLFVTEPTNLAF